MKIIDIVDQPDGSAIVTMDLESEEARLLMEVGFNQILKDSVEAIKNVPIPERTTEVE
jgi:hypothetical protein